MHTTLSKLIKQVSRFATDNSPSLLSAVAVTGVVSTAVLTGKAAFQAADTLRLQEMQVDSHNALVRELDVSSVEVALTIKEKAKLTWKLYIPAAATGAATIACVVGATSIGNKRNAALVSAYSLTDTAFKEYKAKVIEQVGVNKEQKIRDEIAKDRVEANPVSSREVIFTGNGDVLCYETMSGRYFRSNMETLRKAQNDINSQIINDMYASQNDFNRLIGLPTTGYGDQVGWNATEMLELQFSTVLSEKGEPCLAIGYTNTPLRDYYRFS